MTKLNPQVFRDAAERIINRRNDFCCSALEMSAGTTASAKDYIKYLADRFMPEALTEACPWWSNYSRDEGEWLTNEERFEARILALLLCAEMCKR